MMMPPVDMSSLRHVLPFQDDLVFLKKKKISKLTAYDGLNFLHKQSREAQKWWTYKMSNKSANNSLKNKINSRIFVFCRFIVWMTQNKIQ